MSEWRVVLGRDPGVLLPWYVRVERGPVVQWSTVTWTERGARRWARRKIRASGHSVPARDITDEVSP